MRHVFSSAVIGAVVFSAAFAAPVVAQQPMTINDVFQLRSVGSAAISPDGDHVAFTVSVPRDITAGAENGGRDTHLWLYEINGEARPFVTGDISVGGVAWRPGHGTITFRARRQGDDSTVLYEIDPEGGEARRLFAHDESIGDYVWGPAGETLYFVAREDQPRDAFRSRGFTAYAYEENLVFSHVWRVSLADGEAGEAIAYDLGGHASDIEISADGAHLAVALAPTPLIDDRYMARRWNVISAADGAVISAVETGGKTGGVAFSPDGAHLAMLIGSDQNDPTAGTLAIADVQTGDFTLIDVDAEQHIQDMAWANEDTVLALAHVSVGSALVTYSVTGVEESRQRWDSPVIHSFDRHPSSGELAVIYDSPRQPRTLATMSSPSARMSRPESLDLNPWLDDRELGQQRAYSFTASDGVRVDGVLITPRGRAPEGGWPLIMTVHGGPEAHDSNGWLTSYSDPGHIAAGQGYAVLYPNYRGSTGRGQAFARQHQNDYAGREFDDLVDAIAALAEDGIVDPERVGITGGSYGGYASMWGATALSEHFAASVAFVGISNQISKFNTTDIPNEAYLVHSLEWPWEDWMNLLERSPVFHAGGSRTPTLILHGEEDTRVHPSQSLEMYRTLKLRSEAPVRLIYYPGEGHGNSRAAAQFDYAHRMMRWFDHYLMGEGGEPPAADLDFGALLGEDTAD
jgi:dipeptidyl aminopeptidase/acylaminoacyl peptidase